MSYTDKEMQVSTQIAYMNITQDQINEYLKDHNGEYPTIQEILTDSKYGQDICNAFMQRIDDSATYVSDYNDYDLDSIEGQQLAKAQEVLDNIINGMEKGSTNPQIKTVLKILAPLGKTLAIVPIDNSK